MNPPAHATAEFEPMAEGPVVCEYRMRVRVPDGLRPELRSKNLDVRWRFYNRSHWFVRSYYPDDYETVIDGRDCRNRITVGDEIESGKGNLLLSTYKHHDGTRYRAGDLYAEILLARIEDLKQREPELIERAMESLGIDPSEAPAQWSWDHYWRLFCVIEELLPESVLREETERIWKSANDIVWSDTEHNLMKFTEDFVDVNGEPTQTIFPTDARKTCEYSPLTGYSFVRYVNRTIPRMQIVQRHDSGWVNWGTNGENEYPELPSRIHDLVCLWPVRRLGSGGRKDGESGSGQCATIGTLLPVVRRGRRHDRSKAPTLDRIVSFWRGPLSCRYPYSGSASSTPHFGPARCLRWPIGSVP